MTTKISAFRPLVRELGSALKRFQISNEKLRILKTISSPSPTVNEPRIPSKEQSPKTLFILDSSFNPPSIAHRYLSMSALDKTSSDPFPKPHRLLLLFATMNADKAPSAASFDQRLTLMCIFASDLVESLNTHSSDASNVAVDIGLTTVPYYTDKTAAIEAEGTQWYPDRPKHIHLVGYDTLTRLFNPKYYQKFDPPFSALDPYFDAGHRFRVTLRPDDQYGSEDEQRAFLKKIEDGELEKDGGKREWAKLIELVPPNKVTGVSSTKIRHAANRQDWDQVAKLTTPTVAAWVKHDRLYEEDDRGAKMA